MVFVFPNIPHKGAYITKSEKGVLLKHLFQYVVFGTVAVITVAGIMEKMQQNLNSDSSQTSQTNGIYFHCHQDLLGSTLAENRWSVPGASLVKGQNVLGCTLSKNSGGKSEGYREL